MSKVILFGIGGGAQTALRYLSKDSQHEIVAFTVDRKNRNVETFKGLPVVDFENVQDYFSPENYKMFILLNFDDMNGLRTKKFEEAKRKGFKFINYISSNNKFVEEIQIGENCFVLDNQTINLDVKIGDNVVLWSGNHIGDRSIIDNNVWISSQVAIGGDVKIGSKCFLGMHATISHSIEIAEKNFIGAGTLITKSTKKGNVFVQKSSDALNLDSETFVKIL